MQSTDNSNVATEQIQPTIMNAKISVIENLLQTPSETSWIEIAFAIENKPYHIEEFRESARLIFAASGSVQGVLNAKVTSDVTDNSQIVPFVQAALSKKKKVNCLGNALAALLIANANDIPCKMFCSENHGWIELEDTTKVDIRENLKVAKKSPKPLSIYANARAMDNFSLCMLVIVNKNSLSDEEEFNILCTFQEKLRFSWEYSKLFSLANKLFRSESVPADLLHRDPMSLGLVADRVFHYIHEEEDAVAALVEMNTLLARVAQLCQDYNVVDTDWWLQPQGSFLNICEEFTSEFRGMSDIPDIETLYEEWVVAVSSLAEAEVPRAWKKFSTSAPHMSGKRRRVDKDRM